ncbi:methyl-accepting chemotaxis protein [Saccharospirillum alexandrii]|uniref:methyl-accepting chemotaxis protein n=1 Tax=Saccharospirillum alexandrii TaxID=2448477 RepID=UPI000FD86E36|nr:methyl-accepting chemotaxis protein [Saccharospirillum alexandrii]
MKITVVMKTALGFGLMLLLIIGISLTALSNQASIANLFRITTDEVVPQVENAYELVISIQNANKAVSQHAAVESEDALARYEADFETALVEVDRLNQQLSDRLRNTPELQEQLSAAYTNVDEAMTLAAEHLSTRRTVLESRAAFLSEFQTQNSRWLTYTNDMKIVDRVLENLAMETDSVSRQVGADATYVLDRIALIRSGVGGITGLSSAEQVDNVQASLQREIERADTRMERLEGNNEILFRYLSTYMDLLRTAVTGETGTLPRYRASLAASELSTLQLGQLADSINRSIDAVTELSVDLSNRRVALANEVASAKQQAALTVWGVLAASILVALLVMASLIRSIRTPLKRITEVLHAVATGDLTQKMKITSQDEFGQISAGINELVEQTQAVIRDITRASGEVDSVTQQVTETTRSSSTKLLRQKDQSASIATAVTEMTAAASHISDNANDTLIQVEAVNGSASEGQANMNASREVISSLLEEIHSTSDVVSELQQESSNIGKILEVIQNIAEQTNLLALNAAIEAARAGEQGRGFAVVADEVRSLASKTQQSTEEIYQMIDRLQQRANQAVARMGTNRDKAESLVTQADNTDKSIQTILDSLGSITDMSRMIAEGTSEQQKAAESVSETIQEIAELSDAIYSNARRNVSNFEQLNTLVQQQKTSVSRFKYD